MVVVGPYLRVCVVVRVVQRAHFHFSHQRRHQVPQRTQSLEGLFAVIRRSIGDRMRRPGGIQFADHGLQLLIAKRKARAGEQVGRATAAAQEGRRAAS